MEWYEWLNPAKVGQALWNGLNGQEFDTSANISMRADQKAQEVAAQNANITKNWQDLVSNGANSTDMMNFAIENSEWAKENGDFINPFIQSQLNRDNLSKDLSAQMAAFKENGINPLNVTGNLGSLGTSQVDINPAQQAAANDAGNTGLADLKQLLGLMLVFGKLIK